MRALIDLATRRRLPPRLVMAVIYLGGAVGFLVVYARGAVPESDPYAVAIWALVPVLWTAHYLRRTAEALFVHRPRRAFSPIELAGGATYYVGFGLWIASEFANDGLTPVSLLEVVLGTVLFVVGERGNAWYHLRLRRLREGDARDAYAIPRGGLFERVSCPHYLFELVAWAGFFVLQPKDSTGWFLAASFAILLVRALIRHRRYRTTFDGRDGREAYPPNRKALIPFVI